MPTPAEELASRKGAKPKRNNNQPIWNCQLKSLRQNLGLTQREVAKAVKLSPAGYHQVEGATFDICLTTAMRLSEFFGVSIQEIWQPLSTGKTQQEK